MAYHNNLASLIGKDGKHLIIVPFKDEEDGTPPSVIYWKDRRFWLDPPDENGHLWSWTEE